MYDQLLNFNHSQSYGFIINSLIDQEFVFAVDVDEDMEIVMHSYYDKDGNFIVINKTEGEEVKVSVY